jgi:hypothetical protein
VAIPNRERLDITMSVNGQPIRSPNVSNGPQPESSPQHCPTTPATLQARERPVREFLEAPITAIAAVSSAMRAIPALPLLDPNSCRQPAKPALRFPATSRQTTDALIESLQPLPTRH